LSFFNILDIGRSNNDTDLLESQARDFFENLNFNNKNIEVK